MGYYPIHLDLTGKRCLVVGGGKVAERRIAALKPAEARIVCVAPTVTPNLSALASAGAIRWISGFYDARYLDGVLLVIAATDQREVNETIVNDATQRNLLVCCADQSEDGNFVTPSQITRGDLILTVSTSGQSPTLTAVIRETLEEEFGLEWAALTEIIGDLRESIQSQPGGEAGRKQAVRCIMNDPEIHSLLLNGERLKAEARAKECLSSSSE